jgi:hypothetical protein
MVSLNILREKTIFDSLSRAMSTHHHSSNHAHASHGSASNTFSARFLRNVKKETSILLSFLFEVLRLLVISTMATFKYVLDFIKEYLLEIGIMTISAPKVFFEKFMYFLAGIVIVLLLLVLVTII